VRSCRWRRPWAAARRPRRWSWFSFCVSSSSFRLCTASRNCANRGSWSHACR